MIEFANLMNFTAMSLGNHELDDGVEGLVPFVKGKFPSNNDVNIRRERVNGFVTTMAIELKA